MKSGAEFGVGGGTFDKQKKKKDRRGINKTREEEEEEEEEWTSSEFLLGENPDIWSGLLLDDLLDLIVDFLQCVALDDR